MTASPRSPTPPSLAELGWSDRWEALAAVAADDAAPVAVHPARVVRHDNVAVLVSTGEGAGQVGLRPALPPLAVGDWILTDGEVVHALLPRQSLLARAEPETGREQLIAANVDVVGIVCGLDRPVKRGRIERLATLAWDAGARPAVLLTKADLGNEADLESAVAVATAAAPAAEVVAVSAVTGLGVDELRELVGDTTIAFVGESGAGKSTLVNALAGSEVAATGAVREGDRKGRHTTTARELHVLPGHVRLIDTPGLRAVGLWADPESLEESFGDVADLADGCRFRDCVHDTEPGCAVRAAVDAGDLPEERFDSYHRLRREIASLEIRTDPEAARREGKRFGRMAREAQQFKRPSGP